MYVSLFLGFVGIRHFQPLSDNKIRHFQALSGKIRHLQAFSGTFGHFQGRDLDGPAIRNANRGDSRESICANRFAENLYFHNVPAIRANRLKTAIRNF